MLMCICGSTDLNILYNENDPKKKIQCNSCNTIITVKRKVECPKCGSFKISKNPTLGHLKCNDCGNENITTTIASVDDFIDSDIVESNIETNRKNQKLQDTLRIARKDNRLSNRTDNVLEDYFSAIELAIQKHPKPITNYKVQKPLDSEMIIQLSDLHLNEVINNEINKFDFDIASKRLYKYAEKICNYLKNGNFSKVYIVMTGDLINSDVRRDKLIQNATSNGNATVIAFQIISQFIEMINKYANVVITSVSGNESRLSIDKTYTNVTHSNNMDFVVYYFLKLKFQDCNGISFIDPKGYESILNVNNLNVVILHGDNNNMHTKGDINKCITKFTTGYKIIPDLILCGHLHETQIGDIWCRSGSLCGNDEYAKTGLQLVGRASQNIFIVYNNKDFDSIRIDLQNVNNEDLKFNYSEELEEWMN